jgi:uncharacterized membrane protein YqhA
MPRDERDGAGDRDPDSDHPTPVAPLARAIGRTRFVVLVAVAAVLLIAVSLFLFGAVMAVMTVWHAAQALVSGDVRSTPLTVEFLEIVSVMLKAVVFYVVGVGLYSLFIAPLNVTAALGVETLNDLETKVISIVIVIMAVTFLEHFILWQEPDQTMRFGITLAVVVAALVLFQFYNHRASEDQRLEDPKSTQADAQRRMFHRDEEEREVTPEETRPATAGRERGR